MASSPSSLDIYEEEYSRRFAERMAALLREPTLLELLGEEKKEREDEDDDPLEDFVVQHTTALDERVRQLEALLLERRPRVFQGRYLKEELAALRSELDTWRLIQFLERHDVYREAECTEPDGWTPLDSDGRAEELRRADPALLRDLGIVHWLEMLRRDGRVRMTRKNDRYMLHTRQAGAKREADGMVTHIDPDAADRQQRKVDPRDVAEEERLLEHVWDHIRSGDLEGAVTELASAKSTWRAATLVGGRAGVGRRKRLLWKRCCAELAKKSKSGWEQAIYGSLADRSEYATTKCETLHDFLWAWLKESVNYRTDALDAAKLRQEKKESPLLSEGQNDVFEPLPPPRAKRTCEEALSDLEGHSLEVIRQAAKQPYHVVQKLLMLYLVEDCVTSGRPWVDHLSSLIEELARIVQGTLHGPYAEDGSSPDHAESFARFAAHLFVYVSMRAAASNNGRCDLRARGENLIKAYALHVKSRQWFGIVANYAQYLPDDERLSAFFSEFLREIPDLNKRRQILDDASLHIDRIRANRDAITKLLVSRIIEPQQAPMLMEQSAEFAMMQAEQAPFMTPPRQQGRPSPYRDERMQSARLASPFSPAQHRQQRQMRDEATRSIWKTVEGPLSASDEEMISALDLYKDGNGEDALRHTNELFWQFVEQDKLVAVMALHKKRVQGPFMQRMDGANAGNAVLSEAYSWKRYGKGLLCYQNWVTEQTPATFQAAVEALRQALCWEYGLFTDSRTIRCKVVPHIASLVLALCYDDLAQEHGFDGRLHMELASIVASEKYRLYNAFSKQDLVALLEQVSKIEVLVECGGERKRTE